MVSSCANILEQNKAFTKDKCSTLRGLVWNTNMAAVYLFWNTNMADVTPRENALFFLILNRSIYLSNKIRIVIFAFKFHESYFISTLDVFCFFLSFFHQEVKLQVQVLPTLKFQRTWKILNTIYLLWKILRLLRWSRWVYLNTYRA